MSTTTKISLVGTAIASAAALLYAVYKKTEENRQLREENIRMEERCAYTPAPTSRKSKKHKKYKLNKVHWEYDRDLDEWILVDGSFEDPYDGTYEVYQEPQDTTLVYGYTPMVRPKYYPQPCGKPVQRIMYNEPVYDPYGNDTNRYFGGTQYNQPNGYCQGYQTHYPNYGDPYNNRPYEPVGYAWGDPYAPYNGSNGYYPAYAYNQVL